MIIKSGDHLVHFHHVARVTGAFATAIALLTSGLVAQLATPQSAASTPAPSAVTAAQPVAVQPARLGAASAGLREEKAGPPKRLKELDELRGASSKRFVMSDGTIQMELSTEPVHFRDAKGEWQEIQTDVAAATGGDAFANDTTGFRTRFGKSTGRLVRFEQGDASIALGVAGEAEEVTPIAKGSTVTFADVFGTADVRYAVTPTGVKEDIVLEEPPADPAEATFAFELKAGGLQARALDDGSIGFFKRAGDNEPAFVMPAPYMYDDADSRSDAVTQTVTQQGSRSLITVTADAEWLSASDREFPVVVDPTITIVPDAAVGRDTAISEATPTTAYGSDAQIRVGNDANLQSWRGLFQFDTSAIPAGTDIRAAELNVHFSQHHTYDSNSVAIRAHKVTEEWDEATATWDSMETSFDAGVVYTDVVVDDTDNAWTSYDGPWKQLTSSAATNGSLSYTGAMTGRDSFTWNPRVPFEGDYKVFAHITPHSTRGTPDYDVTGNGVTTRFPISQTSAPASGWVKITDSHRFTPSTTSRVTMIRQDGSTATSPVADSVMLREYGEQVKTPNQRDAWHSYAMETLVQEWVNGTAPNHGVMLKALDESTIKGGPYYESSEDKFGGETSIRPKLLVTYSDPSVTLNVPTLINENGAELTWAKYADPSPEDQDNLREYEVYRGCKTLPGSPCATPVVDDFAANSANSLTLVATVAPDTTTWTDTTAVSSTSTAPAVYNYWVVARTEGDSTGGNAQLAASNPQTVTTPRSGRVIRVLSNAASDGTGTTTDKVPDTTISSAQPTAVLSRPDNQDWLVVGNNHATYGNTRALMEFDTSAIPAGVKVTDSRLELWESVGSGSGGTFDVHPLTKDFNENQATWQQATSTSNWTSTGGDIGPSVASLQTSSQAKRLTWQSAAFTDTVQTWVDQAAANHGVLIKASTETAPQQRLNIVNGESAAEKLLRPRLYVEHLAKSAVTMYDAAQVPQRFVPGTIVTVPVTVTNTTKTTWPSNLQLSYRWTAVNGTDDLTTSGERLFTPLAQALEPGESVTKDMEIRTPINSNTGEKLLDYDLYLDLWNGTGWESTTKPPVPTNSRPATGCAVVSKGYLCPERRVEDPTSTQLGLEKFSTYTGEETGAGSQLLTNLFNGNVVWTYDAMQNPSVGPSSFVRVAYNSHDTGSDVGTGYGVSVQPATLLRLGSKLSVPSGGSVNDLMTFVDGDGTEHTYKKTTDTTSRLSYKRPAGVALDLYRDKTTSDVNRQWVLARPDGTKFFFNSDTGLPTAVIDHNGNKLTYVYTNGRLTSVVDQQGRTTLTLGWNGTSLSWIKDISPVDDTADRALKFTYNSTHQLTRLEDGGGFDTSTQTFADPLRVKDFEFGYTETSTNANAKLNSVVDPNEAGTEVVYYTSTETSEFALWPKTISDRRNQVTSFAYEDADGSAGEDIKATVKEVDGSTDPVTTYRMDGFGRSTLITDPLGATTKLGWDGDHNVVRLQEANGAVSTWDYDAKTGYPLTIKDAEEVRRSGAGLRLAYEPTIYVPGQRVVVKSKTSPEGRDSTFGYDLDGNLKTVTDGLDNVTTYDYHPTGPKGLLSKVLDAEGRVTQYGDYDQNGYPRLITDADSKQTKFTYDDRGNVLRVEDALGNLTTAQYDEFGRPEAVTSPGDGVEMRTTRTTYDLNDNVSTQTAPNGAVTTNVYNAADAPVETKLPDNGTGERKLKYVYDTLGRLKVETAPEGTATIIDQFDFTTEYSYDKASQVRAVTTPFQDAGGTLKRPVVTYDYDTVGNVIEVVDPKKNAAGSGYASRAAYDLNHQPVSTTDAAGFDTRTVYDRDGLVVGQIDAAGTRTTTTYDPVGRPLSTSVPHTHSDGTTIQRTTEFVYDKVGNRTHVISPSGRKVETKYDVLNRPRQRIGAHDPNGAVEYRTPSNTYFEYDALGRLARQSDPTKAASGRDWTRFEYFPSGDLKQSVDPWDITTGYTYNKLGQQTSRTLTSAAGTAQRSMSWDYFLDGSLKVRTDQGPPPDLAELLVDNTESGSVKATPAAAWTEGTGATGEVGRNHLKHAAAAAGSAGASDTFSWQVNPTQAGSYQVWVSCPVVTGTSNSAKYTIAHQGGSTEAAVNQSQCTAGQRWVRLGSTEFTFAAGVTKQIVLKPSADGPVIADALKLVKVGSGEGLKQRFEYSYDRNGATARVLDATAGARVASYDVDTDGLGRTEKVRELNASGGELRSTAYTYDLNSNVLSVFAQRPGDGSDAGNLAASRFTEFRWDSRNMIDLVRTGKTSADVLKETQFFYNSRGQRSKMIKANGNQVTNSFFEDGLVKTTTERTATSKGDQLVSLHKLDYTPDGDRSADVSRVDVAGAEGYLDQTAKYAYTPPGQLASVTKTGADPGDNESYVYDAAGNISTQKMTKPAGGATTTTSYSYERNRLQSATVSGSTTNFQYDPFGRTSTSTYGATGNLAERYGYDGFDRVVKHEKFAADGVTNQVTKSSVFDPFDRTTQQTSKVGAAAAKQTRFVYLGVTDQVVSEEQKDAAGVWKVAKSYTYGPGGERLSLADTPVDGSAGSTSYYGTNPHTDTETLTSESTGQTTATYRYTAYGTADEKGTTGVDKVENDPVKDADVVNPYRFNGKRFDGATSSYDMGFRDYSPGLNRFTTRDMYNGALADVALGTDPWNTNRYAFAGGNPVTGVELDGHRATDINHNDGSTDSMDIQVPHCYGISCGAWQATQDAAQAASGDADNNGIKDNWGRNTIGGFAHRAAQTADSLNPLTAGPGFMGYGPNQAASSWFDKQIGADPNSADYANGGTFFDLFALAATGGTAAATRGETLVAETALAHRANAAAKTGTVFRGDGRAAADVFKNGMTARNPGMSLDDHLAGGNGLISTSRSKGAAEGFAIQHDGLIYVIDNIGGTAVKYPMKFWYLRAEREVTFTRIVPSQIRGAYEPNRGAWIPNPNYVGP